MLLLSPVERQSAAPTLTGGASFSPVRERATVEIAGTVQTAVIVVAAMLIAAAATAAAKR